MVHKVVVGGIVKKFIVVIVYIILLVTHKVTVGYGLRLRLKPL